MRSPAELLQNASTSADLDLICSGSCVENESMKTANRNHRAAAAVSKSHRDRERSLQKVIDELFGCLTEGSALDELEREHRAEVLADERHHRP